MKIYQMLNELRKVDQNLALEVRLLDKDDELLFANKVTVDYHDKNNCLLLGDLETLSFICLYFSRDEEKGISTLKVKDVVELITPDKKIDLLIDYDDNFNISGFKIKFLKNKVVLNLVTNETEFEKHNFAGSAISFLNNSEKETIAKFIYEDFKDELYEEFKIESKNSFKSKLSNEEVLNSVHNYVEIKLRKGYMPVV